MSEPRGMLGACLLVGGALGALPAAAENEAREWFTGMSEAVATRTYQGEFLHLSNGRVEKLRILHRFKDGHVNERLVSLTRSGREVVRNDGEVQCYLADQRKVLVESHVKHASLLPLPTDDANLEANYRLELGARVKSLLGRDTRELEVIPRDAFRFGYRLQLDEKTRMPVRTDLCDANGQLLEQVLFTSLKVGGTLPDEAFRPSGSAEGFAWVRQSPAPPQPSAMPTWRLEQLPRGFRISSSEVERLPGQDGPVTHLVVTDGLAMVSVFIGGRAPPEASGDGQGRVGAAFAFSRVIGDHRVTAVGEVPPQTVQLIAAGVAPATAKVGLGVAPLTPQ